MLGLKVIIGGLLVILINYAASTKNFFLAGLVPLFPTFALIACYTIGSTRSTDQLKETVLFSMFSLIPYLIYLAVTYFLADRFNLGITLGLASLSWVVAAMFLFTAWSTFHRGRIAKETETLRAEQVMHRSEGPQTPTTQRGATKYVRAEHLQADTSRL